MRKPSLVEHEGSGDERIAWLKMPVKEFYQKMKDEDFGLNTNLKNELYNKKAAELFKQMDQKIERLKELRPGEREFIEGIVKEKKEYPQEWERNPYRKKE